MSKQLTVLNSLVALFDMIVCIAALTAFAYTAYHFDRWWITLFSLLALLMYNSKSFMIDQDIEDAQKEGDSNS